MASFCFYVPIYSCISQLLLSANSQYNMLYLSIQIRKSAASRVELVGSDGLIFFYKREYGLIF
jgi:hypothetical protein